MKQFALSASGFKGYTSNATHAGVDQLAPPSVNTLVDTDGSATSRLGYENTGWDLSNANEAHTTFYMRTYDITFFAGGTKVYYIDHGRSNTVVDTGLSLTDGTTTRFAEYAGDVYLTNQTDGLRRIVVMRLNDAAATSGDANVTVDVDGAARLSVFGINGSGDLRINGTAEAYNAVTVSTGVITLVGTLSATYADNAIAIRVHDISSTREKFSKLTFWRERMTGIGAVSSTNADQPNANVFFSKFATAAVLENIIDFTFGAGGSTMELVGKSGINTNILDTEDYLYVFKEKATYIINTSDVTVSSGASIPNLRSPVHGCLNEDCAVDMGNGEIAFITNDKRFMRVKISTDSGAPVVFPDESFDVDLREDLKNMDKDQTGALTFYHSGKRRAIFQVKVDGGWTTFVFDNNIRAWQPPQEGKYFRSYFERDGLLYATSATDDTIYLIDSTYSDDGAAIEHKAATGVFDVDDARLSRLEAKGTISPQTTLNFRIPVNNADLTTVSPKSIVGANFSYPLGGSLGSSSLGSTTIAGDASAEQIAEWKKRFDVWPNDANRTQIVASSFGDGSRWKWKSYALIGKKHSQSLTPLS